MRFGLIALLLLAGTANAAEIWKCQAGSHWSADAKRLITAATGPGDGYGSITVAGTVHEAQYSVQGFNRRWSFGPMTDQDIYSYSFVIKPDGSALYFDFTLADEDGMVKSSQYYVCKESK